MNHIVLMGRLTRDPELRHTAGGIAVATFSLAVDRGYTPKDGSERKTDFIDIVAWRNTAEFVSKYFVKGQLTAVAGKLQIRDWVDNDGNKRRTAEVIADNVYFAESKKSREANSGYSAPPAYSQPQGNAPSQMSSRDDEGVDTGYSSPVSPSEYAELEIDDGELPF